jgi:hypothetical protein
MSRQAPRPIHFPAFFSRGIIRPERELNHSLACSTEVRNVWSYTSAPPIRFLGVDRKTFTSYVMLICAGSVKSPTFQINNLFNREAALYRPTNRVMLFSETVTSYCENHTKDFKSIL